MILFQYVFWIFTGFAALFTIFGIYYMLHRMTQKTKATQDYIDTLYDSIWTGRRADRVCAWDRVIYYLYEYEPNRPDLMEEAMNRKLRMQRDLSDRVFVDDSGLLISKAEEI